MNKYFRAKDNQHWQFFTKIKDGQPWPTYLDLVEISRTPIQRHVKIVVKKNDNFSAQIAMIALVGAAT